MSDRDGRDAPAVTPRTRDALLDHYAEMRADVRASDRTRSRRLVHGVAAVAVVLAFAYVEPGRPWVVSTVPVVFTLLFVAHVAAANRAVQRRRQIVAVERLLDVPGVDFEREYGALSERGSRLRNRLPAYALAGCFLVLWLGSMAAGLVEFHADPPTVAGWTVSTALPAVVYLVLVAMVTVSAWTYLATRSEHRQAVHRATRERGRDRQRRLHEFAAADAASTNGTGDAAAAESDDPADADGPGNAVEPRDGVDAGHDTGGDDAGEEGGPAADDGE